MTFSSENRTLFQQGLEVNEKNSFTSYENKLYYDGHTFGFKYNINIGKNYTDNTPLNTKRYEKLLNNKLDQL